MTVDVPADAHDGDQDVVTVTATSQGEPTLSGSSRLATTAMVTACVEVTGVELTRTTEGTLHVGDLVQFSADVAPDNLTPIQPRL